MRKKRKNNALLYLLVVILIAIFGFCVYRVLPVLMDMSRAEQLNDDVKLKDTSDSFAYMDEYKQRKAENADFVGWIKFDSGLVNEPFVQGKTDNTYMRHNFYSEPDQNGTVFMESDQTLDSRNIALYGHYIYADPSLMFSPLNKLLDPQNYEPNKVFRLYLDNEVRVYDVCTVLNYRASSKQFHFTYADYSSSEWKDFLRYVEQHKEYETGVSIDEDANYVTLQTCLRGDRGRRVIVIGKEVQRYKNKGED